MMVVPLGPGKFYGSSLPRPRIYTDVKFNPDRVDPLVPVTDALMSWANEAHWSMGGLSTKWLRMQGRIEGNVNRLRKQKDNEIKSRVNSSPVDANFDGKMKKGKKREGSTSPPPAPKAMKRRKLIVEEESEEEEDDNEVVVNGRRKMVRKLVGDFDKVADEKVSDVVMKTVEEVNNGGKNLKSVKKSNNGETGSATVVGKRSSPRFSKHRST